MKKIKLLLVIPMFIYSCSFYQTAEKTNSTQPILISEPTLIYPSEAQSKNIQGMTQIIFTVSPEGRVTQTHIHKTSGSKELDMAAEQYCSGLAFKPALQDGRPVSAILKWDVRFNLKDFGQEIKYKIEDVKKLYVSISRASSDIRKSQKEILKYHNHVIDNVRDLNHFNEYVYSVIKEGVRNEWKSVAESYPLSFLLYHDFIERFADFEDMKTIELKLENALKKDINFIRNSIPNDEDSKINKETLLKKIETFVRTNYPEIDYENLMLTKMFVDRK